MSSKQSKAGQYKSNKAQDKHRKIHNNEQRAHWNDKTLQKILSELKELLEIHRSK